MHGDKDAQAGCRNKEMLSCMGFIGYISAS
jgi:hypothetical protein